MTVQFGSDISFVSIINHMFVFRIYLRNLGLNRALLKSIVTSYYVLCSVGRYNLSSYQLKYVGAGCIIIVVNIYPG